jgi:Fe2+ or Zn2+ uptake regulation protein
MNASIVGRGCDDPGQSRRQITHVDCVLGEPPCLSAPDANGFVIDEAEVTLWGLCPDCQTTSKSREKETVR